MMISPPKNKSAPRSRVGPSEFQLGPRPVPSRRGFTLLEIVIVLIIVGLVMGGAIATLVVTSSERILTNTSGELELLAKKARAASILRQTPYAIEFRKGYARLLPLLEAGKMERTTAIGGTASDSSLSKPALREEISIDPSIALTIRRWNTTNYITPSETLIPVWRFDPDGLSEPLTVRLTLGDSYAQDTYHPLTATIADSELEAN